MDEFPHGFTELIESEAVSGTQRRGDEAPGGIEFEFEILANAATGVERQHDRERDFRLLLEDRYLLGNAVFREREIFFLQVNDGCPVRVRNTSEDVDELYVHLELRSLIVSGLLPPGRKLVLLLGLGRRSGLSLCD